MNFKGDEELELLEDEELEADEQDLEELEAEPEQEETPAQEPKKGNPAVALRQTREKLREAQAQLAAQTAEIQRTNQLLSSLGQRQQLPQEPQVNREEQSRQLAEMLLEDPARVLDFYANQVQNSTMQRLQPMLQEQVKAQILSLNPDYPTYYNAFNQVLEPLLANAVQTGNTKDVTDALEYIVSTSKALSGGTQPQQKQAISKDRATSNVSGSKAPSSGAMTYDQLTDAKLAELGQRRYGEWYFSAEGQKQLTLASQYQQRQQKGF